MWWGSIGRMHNKMLALQSNSPWDRKVREQTLWTPRSVQLCCKLNHYHTVKPQVAFQKRVSELGDQFLVSFFTMSHRKKKDLLPGSETTGERQNFHRPKLQVPCTDTGSTLHPSPNLTQSQKRRRCPTSPALQRGGECSAGPP